ncbi:MAG: hypothetical protein Q8761_03010 [Sweet potato little leaf phytoplasma]|nr:hypothetical protein [Sweet potato little leaf phytoplasma]
MEDEEGAKERKRAATSKREGVGWELEITRKRNGEMREKVKKFMANVMMGDGKVENFLDGPIRGLDCGSCRVRQAFSFAPPF